MIVVLNCIAVGFGGFLGASLRYLAGLIPYAGQFPLLTLLINFIGCIILSAVMELSHRTGYISPRSLLFLKVGVCGGFTTFSTFSFETMQLLETGHVHMGIAYSIISVALCLAGIMAGKYLVRLVVGQ